MPDQKPDLHSEPVDEVELIDYIHVLCKRKKLILFGTILCMLIAGVLSYRSPDLYRATLIFRPGMTGQIIDQKRETVDDADAIVRRIRSGVYDRGVVEKIHPEKEIGKIAWKVGHKINDHQIIVSLEDPDGGFAARELEALFSQIAKAYEPKISVYKELLKNRLERTRIKIEGLDQQKAYLKDKIRQEKLGLKLKLSNLKDERTLKERSIPARERQIEEKKRAIQQVQGKIKTEEGKIKVKEGDIVTRQGAIRAIQEKIKILDAKKKSLLSRLPQIENNSKDLLQGRDSLAASRKAKKDGISFLLFSDITQKSIEYANNLRNSALNLDIQRTDLKQQVRVENAGIENVRVQIANIKTGIENLKRSIEDIQGGIADIRNEISNIRTQIEGIGRQEKKIKNDFEKWLSGTQKDLAKLDEQKQTLTLSAGDLHEQMKLISPLLRIEGPVVSMKPVGPERSSRILLAAVGGMTALIFLAFFLEYLASVKKREIKAQV
ncbi:MAG: hypothetical protein GXP58_03260 [Deltaproteobacteria bacterium]|nr:hypothetical protein [Deltaproteobacteria bacterium]